MGRTRDQWRTTASCRFASLLLGGSIACAPSENADPKPGTGTISGAFAGRPFERVGASWRIGAPDDPERTLVVYVFDAEIGCDEITEPAWDERIGDDLQSLEIKLIGTAPGEFAVAAGPTPGAGEASVNYTLTATTGTPAETAAGGGSVTLDVADHDRAKGWFDLAFPDADMLSGTFVATPCPAGREP
jgi:hypothetical protein